MNTNVTKFSICVYCGLFACISGFPVNKTRITGKCAFLLM